MQTVCFKGLRDDTEQVTPVLRAVVTPLGQAGVDSHTSGVVGAGTVLRLGAHQSLCFLASSTLLAQAPAPVNEMNKGVPWRDYGLRKL